MKPNSEKEWKGYDMEQLQTMRIINRARIEIETARLRMLAQGGGAKPDSLYSRVSSVMDYIDYGVKAFRISRKFIKWIRDLRR